MPESTLAARTTEHILLNSPADQLVAVQSYAATVVTLLLMAAACVDDLAYSENGTGFGCFESFLWITQCVAASRNWQPFVDLTSPLYVLSRGPGLGSVEEGVLLMHEIAKTPATGMSVAQFRHGFVESVDERVRVVVIGTQSATFAIDHQFALDMTQMGAAVRWIGPLNSGSSLQALGDWPGRCSRAICFSL